MHFNKLQQLRNINPAWKLLCSDNAPLVISFLHLTFIKPNARDLLQTELIVKLDDFLYQLQLEQGEDAFPKSAYAYLEDWSHNDRGWLRKFYPDNANEPAFDLTPATEKAIVWLETLQEKQFVGTESRLLSLFDLLRQIVFGTDESPANRIAELEEQRAVIDRQIEAIKQGDLSIMGASAVKDRFMQFNQISRELLGDFRQIEQNFRNLDQKVREEIATWEGSKGQLLETVFGEQDAIADTDQGKTFNAFWDFLMSSQSQQELDELLSKVFNLEAVLSLNPDQRLKNIHYDWLEVGEQTQKMVQKLSSQLYRFLDNQVYLENKQLMIKLDEILNKAMQAKPLLVDDLHSKKLAKFTNLELPKIDLSFPMERKLFNPPIKQDLQTEVVADSGEQVVVDSLFTENFVDEIQLKQQITKLLQTKNQISLAEVLLEHPLKLGVAELVGYLSIATNSANSNYQIAWQASIDDDNQVSLTWQDLSGKQHQAWLPSIIFTR